MAWHRQLPLLRLSLDQWSAHLLHERLQRAGVPSRLVTVESRMLDKLVTVLKSAFTKRAVRMHPEQVFLLEQLEALKTVETRTPRRDYLKFAPSGTGPEAGQHDDAAVALGLALLEVQHRLGVASLADQTTCELEDAGVDGAWSCVLRMPGGFGMPVDPICHRHCPGFITGKAAWFRWRERTGEW